MIFHKVLSGHTAQSLKLGVAIIAAFAGAGAASQNNATRTYGDYIAPNVSLTKTSRSPVSFAELVEGSKPVVLEFFYTSCTTICGTQTSTLAGARKQLGTDIIFVSVTIDPEYDTPARLSEYASNFPKASNWQVLTGRKADITKVLTAFEARPYGDNKMLHRPLIFIRPADGHQWVRIEGLLTSKQVAAEVRQAIAKPPPESSTWVAIRKTLGRWVGN